MVYEYAVLDEGKYSDRRKRAVQLWMKADEGSKTKKYEIANKLWKPLNKYWEA